MFTPDAYIDYRAMGGVDGHYPEVKAWLAQVLPNFPAYAHMLGNFDVQISRNPTGDTASSRTICFNPMVLDADAKQVLFCGTLVRRRVRPDARGLADDPSRRDEVLRQTGVTSQSGRRARETPTVRIATPGADETMGAESADFHP